MEVYVPFSSASSPSAPGPLLLAAGRSRYLRCPRPAQADPPDRSRTVMDLTENPRPRTALATPIGMLRAVGFAEGVSFLLLLGLAMPMKYLAGLPALVTYVGWAHGVLFVAYVAAVAVAARAHRWRPGRVLKALVASLLPFGPFVLDREWKRER